MPFILHGQGYHPGHPGEGALHKESHSDRGLPGIGLVGNIASQYIVNELKMTYLGAMSSKFFPPIAVLFGA